MVRNRERRPRKRNYKEYYERSEPNVEIPESTLRYVKRPRLAEALENQLDHEGAAEPYLYDYEGGAEPHLNDLESANDNEDEIATPNESIIDEDEDPQDTASTSSGTHNSVEETDEDGSHHLSDQETDRDSPRQSDNRSEDGEAEAFFNQDHVLNDTPPNIEGEAEDEEMGEQRLEHRREAYNNEDEIVTPNESVLDEDEDTQLNTSSTSSGSHHQSDQENDRDSLYQQSDEDGGDSVQNGEGDEGSDFNEDFFTDDSSSLSSSASRRHSDQEEERNRSENEDREESEDDGELNDAFKRLKSQLQNFQEKQDFHINISVGEILINALTLVKKHNWSHLEKEHLMKFVNSVLGKVVPSSRYLLDEYFYSKSDMTYYFYCLECSKLLGHVPARNCRPDEIICTNTLCRAVNNISDLSKASYFVLFHLPSQIEVLLSDQNVRSKLVNPVDFVEPPENNVMTDIYQGSMYRNFARLVKDVVDLETTKVLSLTLSVDSASLCRSFGGQSICPCFVMINELPSILRIGNPLLAGLWFGLVKEKIDLFLPPIVQHIIKLSQEGFLLNLRGEEVFFKMFLIACCADSVARCDIQGIHSHRGDFSCSWCLEEGEEWANARIFRYSDERAPARTLEQLFRDSQLALQTGEFINGVKYLCPLSPAPFFHSVEGFIVDPMHAKDEGTVKSFLKAWLGEFGSAVPFYIKAPDVKKINARLAKETRPPREFRKSPRSFKYLAFWTGREFENWGMYLSIPILSDILPNNYLNHWALYVQACHILLLSEIPTGAIDLAEQLIEEFCSKVETLYLPEMLRFNLHIARHFAANSRRWGPMFALAAYGFEAGNQLLKNYLHSANYVPSQICRAFSEESGLCILKQNCETYATKKFQEDISSKTRRSPIELEGKVKLLHHGKKFHSTEEEEWFIRRMGKEPSDFVQYTALEKNGCRYATDEGRTRQIKSNNSFAGLLNGQIVCIKKILYHEASKEVWIETCKVRCVPSRFCPASVVRFDPSLCFLFDVTSVDEDIEFHSVSELSKIYASMKFNTHFLSPMANIINMF